MRSHQIVSHTLPNLETLLFQVYEQVPLGVTAPASPPTRRSRPQTPRRDFIVSNAPCQRRRRHRRPNEQRALTDQLFSRREANYLSDALQFILFFSASFCSTVILPWPRIFPLYRRIKRQNSASSHRRACFSSVVLVNCTENFFFHLSGQKEKMCVSLFASATPPLSLARSPSLTILAGVCFVLHCAPVHRKILRLLKVRLLYRSTKSKCMFLFV